MNKLGYIFLLLICGTGIALNAAEADVAVTAGVVAEAQPGYVDTFLNNEYLKESAKFIALAEQSFTAAKYDEAIQYAAEAVRFARLSDEYVSLQLKIKEVNDGIALIEARMARARQTGAARRYAETFEEAGTIFEEAKEARDGEDWDKAHDAVRRTLALLDTLPSEPVLAAQYKVVKQDCLWDIAARPEIYGDPFQWRHIYNANRAKMPRRDNPDLIEPGMILDIPSIRGEARFGMMEGRE
jgi:nucleoid-associated protein YgaU